MAKVMMIDPDSGWKYGFPKPLPSDHMDWGEKQMDEWLVSEGYPRTLLKYWKDSKLGYVPCRYWETEIKEI